MTTEVEVHLCYLVKDQSQTDPDKRQYYVIACGLEWDIEAWSCDATDCTCEGCINEAADLITVLKEEGKKVYREQPDHNGPGDPNKFVPGIDRFRSIPQMPRDREGHIDEMSGEVKLVDLSVAEFTEADLTRIEDLMLDWFETNYIPMSGSYVEILRSVKEGFLTHEEWFGLTSVLEAEEEWEIQGKLDQAHEDRWS